MHKCHSAACIHLHCLWYVALLPAGAGVAQRVRQSEASRSSVSFLVSNLVSSAVDRDKTLLR